MRIAYSLSIVLLISLAIPLSGFLLGTYISYDINSSLNSGGLPNYKEICDVTFYSKLDASALEDVKGICQELGRIDLLKILCIYTAIIGLSIPILFSLSSMICGKSRKLISLIIPIALFISILLLSASVLLQGIILTYSVYIAESYFFGSIHPFIILGIGLGAFLGCISLIWSSFQLGKKLKLTVIGKLISKSENPQIFSFVNALAKKIGARSPDNIIIGLDPNFYVTCCDLKIPDASEVIRGESLYLSAPLCRLLTQEELGSVIGHELGHFRGNDTIYTAKFAPIYAGLQASLQSVQISEEEGIASISKLPACFILFYMLGIFSVKESTISRIREFEADKAGVEAGSALALSTALMKITVYSFLWENTRKMNIDHLNHGKIIKNLSSSFCDNISYDLKQLELDEIKKILVKQNITHPTDTHPPIYERFKKIGIEQDLINKDILSVPVMPAMDLISNYTALEEELTLMEHQLMVACGLAAPPEDNGEVNSILHVFYIFAASIVKANNKIDRDKLQIAEKLGNEMFEDFDPIEFREYCSRDDIFDKSDEIAEAISPILDGDAKKILLDALQAVAEADGKISESENVILQNISNKLQGVLR